MKNYSAIFESDTKFLLVNIKAENYSEACLGFSRLSYAMGILEYFTVKEVIETKEEGVFLSFARIVRVREKSFFPNFHNQTTNK